MVNNAIMNRPRAIVVEDDEFTRALLVNALQSENIDVILDTSSATYALKVAPKMNVDVAILDLNLGSGPTGLDLALGLRRNQPNIGIVFLTSYKDPRLLGTKNLMAPFGTVYMEKRNLSDIAKLRRGVDKALVNAKNAHYEPNVDFKAFPKSTTLTNTQIEILRLVSQGHSNLEISQIRGVTEKSIEQALSRILKNTNIKGDSRKNRRVELALYYMQQTGNLLGESE
jgi:DNA-binding NarL/FixJ family response regulator